MYREYWMIENTKTAKWVGLESNMPVFTESSKALRFENKESAEAMKKYLIYLSHSSHGATCRADVLTYESCKVTDHLDC